MFNFIISIKINLLIERGEVKIKKKLKIISVFFILITIFSTKFIYAEELYNIYQKSINNPLNFDTNGSYWNEKQKRYDYNVNTSINMNNLIWNARLNYDIFNPEKNSLDKKRNLQKIFSKENIAADITITYLRILADNKCQHLINKIESEINKLNLINMENKLFKEKNTIYIFKTKRRYERHKRDLKARISEDRININRVKFFWNIEEIKKNNLYKNLVKKIKNKNIHLLIAKNQLNNTNEYPVIKGYASINGNKDMDISKYELGINVNYNTIFLKNVKLNTETNISTNNLNNNLRIKYPKINIDSVNKQNYYIKQIFNNQYKIAEYIIEDIELLKTQYKYYNTKEKILDNRIKYSKENTEKVINKVELLKIKINKINLVKKINENMLKLIKVKGELLSWIKEK